MKPTTWSCAKNPGSQRGSTLIGIFIGLVIGVVASAGVVWYLNKATLPFQDKGIRPETPKGGDGKSDASDKSSHAQSAGNADSLPGKPGEKPAEKRFTFYDILPGNQEASPAPSASNADKPAAALPAVPPGEVLFLQAGAFQKPADADSLKARLALIGVEASVQEVNVADKGTMYRVRVGPYQQIEDMNHARGLLAQNGIPVSVVRAKEVSKP